MTTVAQERDGGDRPAGHVIPAALWREPERARLVRLCAAITGDPHAAEDLAQETLLEAWRNAHKLRDPAGADRWLTAIARNVCLRWARSRGRNAPLAGPVEGYEPPAAGDDLEVELERAELAELLDRALGLLPADTREVLVQRYVHESPHAAIAERLGVSEDAVSMRLTRGKVVLRSVLASELREEAVAYGLLDPGDEDGGWRETRIWCAECGSRRLLARRDPPGGVIAFRCRGCNPDAPRSQFRLENPSFARLFGPVSRPSAILARVAEWSWRYHTEGAKAGEVACTRCAAAVPLARYFRDRDGWRRDGLFAACAACGEEVSSSARGLAWSAPEMRRFRRRHPRTRAVPERELEAGGVPALAVRYEDVLGAAGVEVVLARDTLRVLDVRTG